MSTQLCFETEEKVRRILHNVSSLLKPGGFFLGICPDSSTIWYGTIWSCCFISPSYTSSSFCLAISLKLQSCPCNQLFLSNLMLFFGCGLPSVIGNFLLSGVLFMGVKTKWVSEQSLRAICLVCLVLR